MEKTELINKCAGLINHAAAHNRDGEHDATNADLADLLELLTPELTGSAPSEPANPEDAPQP